MSDFKANLAQVASQTEDVLRTLLPDATNNPMADPMRHAVLNGGKRLRAFLAVESAALFDVDPAQSYRAAAAIECMHAYSLVHDDLPCMDDDDLRRGQPTVHIKWDDATAVLAGDALQTLAIEILADAATSDNPNVRVKLISDLARASGANGMVLGQAQDIAAETATTQLSLAQITTLQENKTGALIKWSAIAGATLAQQDTTNLATYADAVGLAFQIQDDILDVEGDAALAGKRLQKDAEAGKATFVSLLGLDQAKAKANSLVEVANEALSTFGDKADPLRHVAQFVISRDV